MRNFFNVFALCICFCSFANAQQKPYKAYVVSNAHFDSQWNWTVQRSIEEYLLNTMVQNFWLFDKYPNYVFNFEGGVKYSWMKEYYPELYEKVKKYIASGRWHVSGSSWDATDTNIPSPESFLRNILYGQEFYKKEFGVTSKDIFLPDCFGFGYAMPSLASHAGLIGFSTQKLQWRVNPFFENGQKIPFPIGLWEGVDGARIMVALDAKSYGKRWDGEEDISYDKEMIDLAQNGPNNTVYRYYGTGDTGGSPSIGSVASVEKGYKSDGPLDIIIAGSDQLFENYYPFENHPELPVYKGELLQDVHATGVYTSQAAMKRFNRRNEQLADAAERASVIADWFGGLSYPAGTLDDAWKRFLWHQFHDDLTGTSTPYVYSFSWNDELISQAQFADIIITASGAVGQAMNTAVKGTPLLVYNPTAYSRTDIVTASIPFTKQPKNISVYGPSGKPVPAQLISYKDNMAVIIFAASVQPVSYSVYEVREGMSKQEKSLKASKGGLENNIYKITLDENGDIASLVDKRNGKELVEKGKSIRLALFEKNVSTRWPAWEILKTTIDETPVSLINNVKISVEENGPLRITLKITRNHGTSTFVQYISLTEGAADDCITVRNEVDWSSSGCLLKAEFPLNISNSKATYDLGLGVVQRGNNVDNAYEIIAQQWADISTPDNSYGFAVINDCKYGWDKPADNIIRLTLLHTPETARNYAYQNRQDFGHHTFTYALMGHKGTYLDAGLVAKSEALNQPLISFTIPKHNGPLGRSYCFIESISTQLAVKAIKKAQDGNAYVVRVFESAGKEVKNGVLSFAEEIESAKELNGVEEFLGDAPFQGNKLLINAKAFQPKTYSITFKKPSVAIAPAKNKYVPLNYTAQAYSIDAFKNAVRFDRSGNSYAAELIPEEIITNGISFIMGEALKNHVIKCMGDTIQLPSGHNSSKLYMLVSSTDTNRITTFKVDNKEYTVKVPYYSGKFGQWGLDGFSEGYVIGEKIGFVGSHRHTRAANEPYVFTYMYVAELDIDPNASFLYLPKNNSIAVFAVTLSDNKFSDVLPAWEFRALPYITKEINYNSKVPETDPRMMRR